MWAHTGLSEELTTISADGHIRVVKRLLDRYPTRAITGADFVASADKSHEVYAAELEVTSRINRDLGDEAFRAITLGQNCFRLLGIEEGAPRICARLTRVAGAPARQQS